MGIKRNQCCSQIARVPSVLARGYACLHSVPLCPKTINAGRKYSDSGLLHRRVSSSAAWEMA